MKNKSKVIKKWSKINLQDLYFLNRKDISSPESIQYFQVIYIEAKKRVGHFVCKKFWISCKIVMEGSKISIW